jgi:uncharacterized membrane protein YhaH (DUF805 family)
MSIKSLLWSYEGRIGRASFWLGVLLVILMAAAIGLVAGLVGYPLDAVLAPNGQEAGPATIVLMIVAIIAATYAQLAVYVKRFHDRGKSGWWVLIAFVPLIGFLWILIELGMLPGDPGRNAYGPPEAATSA